MAFLSICFSMFRVLGVYNFAKHFKSVKEANFSLIYARFPSSGTEHTLAEMSAHYLESKQETRFNYS